MWRDEKVVAVRLQSFGHILIVARDPAKDFRAGK